MKRIEPVCLFSISFSLFLFIGCTQSEKQSIKERPNVLIILTDQQSNDAVSFLGNPNLNTPAMDQLAAEGTYFMSSYCTTPVCGPARSSLITGRMPHETGVIWNSTSIDPSIPTMGHIFEHEGFQTAYVGKWHLPQAYPAKNNMDSVSGFKMIPFQSLSDSWELGVDTDGPIADAAVQFIENYDGQHPFLLTVSLHNPHDICHVPRRPDDYAKAGELNELPPLPPNFEISDNEPEFLMKKRLMEHYGDELFLTKDYSSEDWRAYLYHYYRFTELVDIEVGKIMDALKSNGLDENTLVIFTSDHGDGAASHKWAAKLSLYEEPATVPFIIRWKGHIPAAYVDRNQLVSAIDILPTIMDYSGIEKFNDLPGKSLRQILEDPNKTLREYLVMQLADDKLNSSRHGRMIRDVRYKYNLYNQGARNEQLFDLWKDPGEMYNLAYDNAYENKKNSMKAALDAWIDENGDNFYTWNPIPTPNKSTN